MTAEHPFQELQRVVLTTDLPEHGLAEGDVGTVVDVYAGGEGYEVEFVTLTGETVGVLVGGWPESGGGTNRQGSSVPSLAASIPSIPSPRSDASVTESQRQPLQISLQPPAHLAPWRSGAIAARPRHNRREWHGANTALRGTSAKQSPTTKHGNCKARELRYARFASMRSGVGTRTFHTSPSRASAQIAM